MKAKHAVFSLALLTLAASAETGDVPPSTQASFILRVMTYNRNLTDHPSPGTLSVGVVYLEGNSESEAEGVDITSALENAGQRFLVAGAQIRGFRVPFNNSSKLEIRLAAEKAVAIYVCRGLGDHLREISTVAQRRRTLSFTGLEPYVRSGLSVGIIRQGSRPALLVNLTQSRAEGADLDSGLLGIALVIH